MRRFIGLISILALTACSAESFKEGTEQGRASFGRPFTCSDPTLPEDVFRLSPDTETFNINSFVTYSTDLSSQFIRCASNVGLVNDIANLTLLGTILLAAYGDISGASITLIRNQVFAGLTVREFIKYFGIQRSGVTYLRAAQQSACIARVASEFENQSDSAASIAFKGMSASAQRALLMEAMLTIHLNVQAKALRSSVDVSSIVRSLTTILGEEGAVRSLEADVTQANAEAAIEALLKDVKPKDLSPSSRIKLCLITSKV